MRPTHAYEVEAACPVLVLPSSGKAGMRLHSLSSKVKGSQSASHISLPNLKDCDPAGLHPYIYTYSKHVLPCMEQAEGADSCQDHSAGEQQK